MTTTLYQVKQANNFYKVLLGSLLIAAEEMCDTFEYTFPQLLAEIQLNKRRVKQLMDNARFLRSLEIKPALWKYLDSSVIELLRKSKRPLVIDDLKELSYSDLKKYD